MKQCSIDECDSQARTRGWCWAHFGRWRRYGDPLAEPRRLYRSGDELDRLLAIETDECVLWTGQRERGGYGSMIVSGHRTAAHREALRRTVGPPPAEYWEAAHSPVVCHNRACVNPRHLRWATRAENAADMRLDGTRGGRAKLTLTDVQEIRRRYAGGGVLQRELAEEFGVTQTAISAVVRGKVHAGVAILSA